MSNRYRSPVYLVLNSYTHFYFIISGILLVSGAFWIYPNSKVVRTFEENISHAAIQSDYKIEQTENQTNLSPFTLQWSSQDSPSTRNLIWGDYDSDGDLDLAIGMVRAIELYVNNDGIFETTILDTVSTDANALAWADYDNDGDLDLAVATGSTFSGPELNRLYNNHNGMLISVGDWQQIGISVTTGLAWGDYDSDGFLDLAVLNHGEQTQVYKNYEGTLKLKWESNEKSFVKQISWVDYDNDGDLDLAAAQLYENDNSNFIAKEFENVSIGNGIWADYNCDNLVDVAINNTLYRNEIQIINNIEEHVFVKDITLGTVATAIAWGNYDNDRDLDLAVAQNDGHTELFKNDCGVFTETSIWETIEIDNPVALAWSDYDNDGDLDLTVGNLGDPTRIYSNDFSVLENQGQSLSAEQDDTRALAWGDYDSDNDLDLFVGNGNLLSASGAIKNRLYQNNNGTLSVVWEGEPDVTNRVAWGDYDNDGDLDLAVANGCYIQPSTPNHCYPSRLYLNQFKDVAPTDPPFKLIWEDKGAQEDGAWDVAWGDYDNDGDLDLAIGYSNGRIRVYHNNKGSIELNWVTPGGHLITNPITCASVAWGDYDRDGDLDLAVGRHQDVLYPALFRNDSGRLTTFPVWYPDSLGDEACDVAWGDYNGDGTLDLAVGNRRQPNRLYRNDNGALTIYTVWSSIETDNTEDILWADYDGDRDIDLLAVNGNRPVRLYRNDNGQLPSRSSWLSTESSSVHQINTAAWGDYDNDGDLDLATAVLGESNRIYVNRRSDNAAHAKIPVIRQMIRPDTDNADFLSVSKILTKSITFNYFLSDADSNSVKKVIGMYALEGGGESNENTQWIRIAKPDNDPQTTNLATSPNNGTPHSYTWDLSSSNIVGLNNNVIFRLVVIPAIENRPNQTPGPYLFGSFSAATFPFRIRGNQIQVVDEIGQPRSGALVYRLPVGQPGEQSGAYIPYKDSNEIPFYTDNQGFLQGRGEIKEGDRLVALVPITATETYTLFHTNAVPSPSGIAVDPIQDKDIHILQVSPSNPLIWFNFDVSLEWDARNDPNYLAQLESDIKRTSEIVYDLSNGQAVLGHVRVYQAKEHWLSSDIQVVARNDQRPNANLGGIVSKPMSDTVQTEKNGLVMTETISNAILPGHIRMGATWNRYGEPGGTLGEDWPRALAHEIGHYAFFLLDNYLGLSDNGLLIAAECVGSMMTNSYRDDYSEYLDRREFLTSSPYQWIGPCEQTIAAKTTGRADWQTIRAFYPSLMRNNLDTTGSGPGVLPLDITKVSFVTPSAENNTLDAPFVFLADSKTKSSLPLRSGEGQTYLFKTGNPENLTEDIIETDDQIILLGSPNGPLIEARGATPGDRICVYANAQKVARIGCVEEISTITTTVPIAIVPEWQPQIDVTPINSATLAITVTQAVPLGELYVQVYPRAVLSDNYISLIGRMDSIGPISYTKVLSFPFPIINGYIRIWVQDSEPLQESVVPFFISPGWQGDEFAFFGGDEFAFYGGDEFAFFGDDEFAFFGTNLNSWSAPTSSADGQVAIFNLDNILRGNVAAILQPLTVPPSIPPWLTPVGQVYRYKTSEPSTNRLVIQFQYLERELPDVLEKHLRIYFSSDEGKNWVRQENTFVDPLRNLASTEMRGQGLYALMATIETPSLHSGWNHFAYPDTSRRRVENAIASVAKDYMSVAKQVDKGEDGKPVPKQWRLYDPRVEKEHPEFSALVNNLQTMQPLESYWIYVVTDTVPYIGVPVADDTQQIRASGITELPPATFYGWVLPTEGFAPQPGNEIIAVIDHGDDMSICGTGVVMDRLPEREQYLEQPYKLYLPLAGDTINESKLFYKIQVRADTGEGCGVFGHDVTFYINGRKMENNHPWGNSQACFHPLGPPSVAPPTDCFQGPAPDLVVERVTVLENDLQVVIKNTGTAAVPAGAGFWVDAYINPDPNHLPSKVNDIWQDFTNRGIAWGLIDLSEPIDPGDMLTLTVGSPYFMAEFSDIRGGWSAGTPIYVQVDSAHALTSYGSVLESHEIRGEAYNNIWPTPAAPVITAATIAQGNIIESVEGLPPRR